MQGENSSNSAKIIKELWATGLALGLSLLKSKYKKSWDQGNTRSFINEGQINWDGYTNFGPKALTLKTATKLQEGEQCPIYHYDPKADV